MSLISGCLLAVAVDGDGKGFRAKRVCPVKAGDEYQGGIDV